MQAEDQGIPPVIIIGMHRAGTSMLARMLNRAGMYIGRRLTRNGECPFINSLNYWVFDQASARWDRPAGVDDLVDYDTIRPVVSDYLRGVVDGPASVRYLGPSRWVRHRSLHLIAEPWGWKDPRNTYTLPLWLDVFPKARVVHITRHGMDVAQSLRVRHLEASRQAVQRYRRRRGFYVNNPFAPKRGGFAHSPAVADLERGLALWRAYTERAQSHVRTLRDQAYELRYEDLLASPADHLPAILRHSGIDASEQMVRHLIDDIRVGRRYAYKDDAELAAVARENATILQACGYNA